MNEHAHSKVTAQHLKRPAYLYVRQSSMRQVVEHRESTQRQYDLKQRAVALGWPLDRVVTIDDDLGVSAGSPGRQGFARLVSEVGMGQAGIVMGLEVSRLARNSSDWHRLLEICALSSTLILDEEGVYDPAHFNDRLLLGLKGTMSEAELHLIRARLMGGMLNKARRGELRTRLPIGLVYGPGGQVVMDPDQQVQQSVRSLFATFRRVGTIFKTVRAFAEQGLPFPRRMYGGPRDGEVLFGPLTLSAVYNTLHNPRYAGAYVYGRRTQRHVDDSGRLKSIFLPQQEWPVLIRQAHEGYITWEDFEENQRRLSANARGAKGAYKSPVREGPALLQGLVVCGVCGRSMSVRYHTRSAGRSCPEYTCAGPDKQRSGARCQSILGQAIDDEVGKLLVEAMSPVSLEVSLAVQQELQERIEEADALRHKQVDRARYEAELCRRRYMRVDPDNRLVADELEAQWNLRLKELATAEEEYQRRRQADRQVLNEETRAKIMALSCDFPRLWNNPRTPQRERKRMVRLLLADVTLLKEGGITVHIRFKGGATRTFILPCPKSACELFRTEAEVIEQIDRLLDEHTFCEIADILNRRKAVSGFGNPFDGCRVRRLAKAYHLKSRYTRLRQRGLLTLDEVAQSYGRCKETVKQWRREGHLRCVKLDDMGQYLYEGPGREPSTNE